MNRKVLMSEELFQQLGASRVEWGEPDAEGFYTPTVYALASPSLDVEALARAMPDVMSQETCDAVMGPGHDPLDLPEEWYRTPREMATAIAAEYDPSPR